MRLLAFVLLLSGCASFRRPASEELPFEVVSIDVVQVSAPAGSGLHSWYQQNLGLASNGFGNDGWQQFDIEGSSSFAVNYGEDEPLLAKQGLVPAFKVTDIHAAVKHLQGKGATFLKPDQPIQESNWGFKATLRDPQGHWFQILEDK